MVNAMVNAVTVIDVYSCFVPSVVHCSTHCGTVCLNSFGKRTSLPDNSNDRWKRLCLVSRAAAPCVWTL